MFIGRKVLRSVLILALTLIFAFPVAAQQENVTHTVQSGETLFRIALRYGVDMNTLAQSNNISDLRRIFTGQVLVIPGLTAPSPETTELDNPLIATAPILHTVQRGENLSQIAQLYGVSMEQILLANNIANASRINAGQQLQIWSADLSDTSAVAAPEAAIVEAAPEAAAPEVQLQTVTHVVQRGEILSSIAQRYGVSAQSIMQANGLSNPNRILVGQNLSIPGTQLAIAEATPVEVAAAPETFVQHVVQPGEILSQIARRYNVSWTAIAEANNISDPNRVFTGTTLNIPNANGPAQEFGILSGPTIADPGARVGVGREIVVVLSEQRTYAYEDGRLVRSVVVSTGLPATPTVTGDYRVYLRYDTQNMSGPGYYLPGVQWVMYFYQGYGIHGTYWHNNFGQPMSRGCVNMTNEDALWFYNFATIGTPVHVRL